MKGGIVINLYKGYYRRIPIYPYRTNYSFVKSRLQDYGPDPLVVNLEEMTKRNPNFRLTLWTGNNLQLVLMSIDVGSEIGLEMHPDVDQFIRIEEGEGIVRIGDTKDMVSLEQKVEDDYAIVIPAGKWHNVINTGNKPLKLYTIYAPAEHPHSTVQKTKAEAMDQGRYYYY